MRNWRADAIAPWVTSSLFCHEHDLWTFTQSVINEESKSEIPNERKCERTSSPFNLFGLSPVIIPDSIKPPGRKKYILGNIQKGF